MKIGIATFSNSLSYGAMLQAYALKKAIERMGYEVTVLGCSKKYSSIGYWKNSYIKLKSIKENRFKHFIRLSCFWLFQKHSFEYKAKRFENFKVHYLCGNNEDYDLLICGSDQIWNPEITNGYSNLFFGNDGKGSPSIAYAGSVGDIKVIEKYGTNEFIKKLERFENISCREDSLNSFLISKGVSSTVVLDPTLLITHDMYDQILSECVDKNYSNYIFVFRLGKSNLLTKVARKIAKKKKLKIVTLQGSGIPVVPQMNVFGDSSPNEFISLIKNAEYIITDSFHGLALSLVYKKDFNVILPIRRKDRLENLLNLLNLNSRIVNDIENVDDSPITYFAVDRILSDYQEHSINYLKENIHKIDETI